MMNSIDTLDDYLNNPDERVLIISIHEEFSSLEEPLEVFYAFLPAECELERGELFTTFATHLYGKDGFSLEYKHRLVECGLSGMVEEVQVEVLGGLGTALLIFAGSKLKEWLSKSGSSPVTMSHDDCLEHLLMILSRRYKKVGSPKLISHEETKEFFYAVFQDDSGTIFRCSVDRQTHASTIQRQKFFNENDLS